MALLSVLAFLVLVYIVPGHLVLPLIPRSLPGLSSLVLEGERLTDLDLSYACGALLLFVVIAVFVNLAARSWLVARPQDEARLARLTDGRGLGPFTILVLTGVPLLAAAGLVANIQNRPHYVLTGPLFVLLLVVWWGLWLTARPALASRRAVPQPVPMPTGGDARSARTFRWIFDRSPYMPQTAPVECIAELHLGKKEYDERHSEAREIDCMRWDQYVRRPSLEVAELAMQLTRIRASSGMCAYEEIANVLAFSQPPSIAYAFDGSPEQPTEWPKYPIETLWDGRGDCEDHAILAAAILKRLGYDVALLFLPGHAALGVAGADGLPGRYVRVGNLDYYFCETAGEGWRMGELPPDLGSASIQTLPIASEAVVDPLGSSRTSVNVA